MTPPTRKLSQLEFIALLAMIMSTVAFSIDAMLPALPRIAADLSPDAPNRAQLIITFFVLGLGTGTLFMGPISDRFGRKAVIYAGVAVYAIGALLAWAAPTIETMLAARILQGLGAAAPRVVSLAMVRDLYSGREMARIMSFAMLFFSLVPAFAPTMGAGIVGLFGWRSIFISFLVFSVVMTLWLGLRQPETLPPPDRRPLDLRFLVAAAGEVISHPTTRLCILVQTLCFGMLFSVLSSTQQVFDQTYGQGDTFHLWFGGIAIIAASASILNARLVVRTGMRPMIKGILTVQIMACTMMIAGIIAPLGPRSELLLYAFWTVTVFFQAGLTIGNLNALAMEPMGHIAGMAASLVAALATVGSVIIAIPIGLSFDGTPLPLALGVLLCAVMALYLTTKIRRDADG